MMSTLRAAKGSLGLISRRSGGRFFYT
jgi:hypothetical protein